MILTRVYLNLRRRGAKHLLGSPQAMHAAILAGFPPGIAPGRPLWRVDEDDPLKPTLYVLSQERPDFTHLEEQAGWPTQPTTVSASYAPLLETLDAGQRWGFRLTANPTHRLTSHGTTKVVAHVSAYHQQSWLLRRAESIGVDLGPEGELTFQLVGRQVKRFRRAGDTVTLGMATFNGVFTVTDPSLLKTALTQGIGRAKAYGCGLMTLARQR